jgi:hypothetical protein
MRFLTGRHNHSQKRCSLGDHHLGGRLKISGFMTLLLIAADHSGIPINYDSHLTFNIFATTVPESPIKM